MEEVRLVLYHDMENFFQDPFHTAYMLSVCDQN